MGDERISLHLSETDTTCPLSSLFVSLAVRDPRVDLP